MHSFFLHQHWQNKSDKILSSVGVKRASALAMHASGVSREFVLVEPQRGPIKVCFYTPKVAGSGSILPQEKSALMREIQVHSGWYIIGTHYLQTNKVINSTEG